MPVAVSTCRYVIARQSSLRNSAVDASIGDPSSLVAAQEAGVATSSLKTREIAVSTEQGDSTTQRCSIGVVKQVLDCANPYKPPSRLSKTADKTQTDCSRHKSLRTMPAGCLTLGTGCRMQSNVVQHTTRPSCHHAQPHQPRLVCASINMPACSVRLRPTPFFGSGLATSSGG